MENKKKSTQAQVCAGDGASKRINSYYPTPRSCVDDLLRYQQYAQKNFLQSGFELNKNDILLEPACGEGAISKVLEGYGYSNIISTELYKHSQITHDFGETFVPSKNYGTTGINFLNNDIHLFLGNCKQAFPQYAPLGGTYGYVSTILTNPPFITSTEFALQAFTLARKYVILLVKLNFLASEVRTELLWRNKSWNELTEKQQRSDKFNKYKEFVIAKDKCGNNFRLKDILIIPYRLTFEGYKESSPLEHAWFIWENNYKSNVNIDWIGK